MLKKSPKKKINLKQIITISREKKYFKGKKIIQTFNTVESILKI